MGRRVKAPKIHKKYLFMGVGIAAAALAVVIVLATSLSLTACRRNPLMNIIGESGITVKAGGKSISHGGSYDVGRVKQGGSYETTFTIVNSGNQDLELTGSPLVRIEGGAAAMFGVLQEPSNLIRVKGDCSFVISYKPIGEGETNISLCIENNSETDDFSFELSSYVDGTPPTIDVKTPQGTEVPTNVVVSATFSEDMDPDSINETTFTLTGSVSKSVDSTVSYYTSTLTAYLQPVVDLSPTEWHTVTLSTSGITDLAGNPLFDAGGGIWIFQTGAAPDTDPPEVDPDSLIPGINATDVPWDTIISATFNEDLDPSTVSTSTFKLMKGAVEVAGSVSYSAAAKTATFTPDVNLDPSTDYTATLMEGIEDTVGNATVTAYEWSFTTEAGVDNTPPEVTEKNPIAGASDVATNVIISARFNERIDETTVTTSTFTLTDSVSGPVDGDVAYDANSMTATFTPTWELTGGNPGPLFAATLTSGIADESGNNLSPVSWTFTTGAGPDSTPPIVSSTIPLADATGVLVSADIKATFSEAMDATTINTATFKLLEDGVEIDGTVSYNDSTFEATFNPAGSLKEALAYRARITTGAEDSAGIPLGSDYEWSFITEAGTAPPQVDDVEPDENAIDVDLNTDIVVHFTKLMDDTTITTSTFTVSKIVDGIPGSPIAGSVSYDDVTRKATFTPSSPLAGDTDYLVECKADMTDIGGVNALAYFSSVFTTVADNKWGSMIWGVGKWGP
jgi:hypothetical protein